MTQLIPRIVSRLPDVGTTIFTVMSKLAQDHGAINLSQGFPDFSPPQALMDSLTRHMAAGHNQYAPMAGVMGLREAIARKAHGLYGADYDPEHEITVTAGATQAIFCAIACMVRPGDEVIVFDPVYDSYGPAIELNGGKPIHAKLSFPDFRPDWAAVRQLVTAHTRMIIINSPHNPSGSVLKSSDMLELAAIVHGTDIIILSDEVYEHMVFDGAHHRSVAHFPALAERSFVVSSFGKTYHATGWKIAYCLAPRDLMLEFRKAHQFVTFCVHAPSQYALAEFMQNESWYEELTAFYQAKRDFFRLALAGSRLELLPCSGTYFQLARYDRISDDADTNMAQSLIYDHGVAAIPISVFYADGEDNRVLRFCFAKSEDTLSRAAERLCRL